MRTRGRSGWAGMICVLALVGCGGDGGAEGGPGAGPAGVPGSLHGPDMPLEWAADTVATVGGATAPEWASFQEASGLAFDGAGRLYLLDGPQRRIAVVDSTGRFLGTVGVAGEGPGEFRVPARLGVGDDGTVWVYDAGHGALLVFGPDAESETSGESVPTGGPGSARVRPPFLDQYPVDEQGWIPAGSLLVQDGRVIFAARPRGGAGSDASVALDAGSRGDPRDRRAVVAFTPPASVTVLYRGWAPPIPVGRPLTAEETGGFRVRLPPVVGFPPELHAAILPGGALAVADSTDWSVVILASDGTRTATLGRPFVPTPVTGGIREREQDRRLAVLEADPPRMVVNRRDGGSAAVANESILRLERARIDAMGFHAVIPVIQRMAADPEGRIWVQRHSGSPGRPGPVDVATADGDYLGTLPPDGLRVPVSFGPDGLMATVAPDELGAPVIHILRLR